MPKPPKLIKFDEGWFMSGQLDPMHEDMIRRAEQAEIAQFGIPSDHFGSEGSMGDLAAKQRAEVERKIDDANRRISAAFGQWIDLRIIINAERARAALEEVRRALAESAEMIRAERLYPWLVLGLLATLAALTGWLIGAWR